MNNDNPTIDLFAILHSIAINIEKNKTTYEQTKGIEKHLVILMRHDGSAIIGTTSSTKDISKSKSPYIFINVHPNAETLDIDEFANEINNLMK